MESYKKFVSALTLFQAIINGRFFADILKENRVYQQILLNMIHNFQYKYGSSSSSQREKGSAASSRNGLNIGMKKHHLTQDSNTMVMNGNALEYNSDIPEYIQDLFEYFYLNQHYVWIIQSQIQYLEPSLRKYFVPSRIGKRSGINDSKTEDDDIDDDDEDDNLQRRYVLNLAGDYNVKQQSIKSYPLKYCAEYTWSIEGDDFERFKNMKNGEWINCPQDFRYEINQFEYELFDGDGESRDMVNGMEQLQLNGNGNHNEHDDEEEEEDDLNEECFAVFQCSCAPSKTGKHSFFMKVDALSENLERILFGVDLFCPSISFKTSVPRRWFRQNDYLGYTMFDSSKLNALQKSFEWHIAIKIYDYKKHAH